MRFDECVSGVRHYKEDLMSDVRLVSGASDSRASSSAPPRALPVPAILPAEVGVVEEPAILPLEEGVVDREWLGCDVCGQWHKVSEQTHETWVNVPFVCADLGAQCLGRRPRKVRRVE